MSVTLVPVRKPEADIFTSPPVAKDNGAKAPKFRVVADPIVSGVTTVALAGTLKVGVVWANAEATSEEKTMVTADRPTLRAVVLEEMLLAAKEKFDMTVP